VCVFFFFFFCYCSSYTRFSADVYLYSVTVNHKTEDEILRSLNRHAQRKLLSNLQSMRQERDDHKATSVSDEQSLERYVLGDLHIFIFYLNC